MNNSKTLSLKISFLFGIMFALLFAVTPASAVEDSNQNNDQNSNQTTDKPKPTNIDECTQYYAGMTDVETYKTATAKVVDKRLEKVNEAIEKLNSRTEVQLDPVVKQSILDFATGHKTKLEEIKVESAATDSVQQLRENLCNVYFITGKVVPAQAKYAVYLGAVLNGDRRANEVMDRLAKLVPADHPFKVDIDERIATIRELIARNDEVAKPSLDIVVAAKSIDELKEKVNKDELKALRTNLKAVNRNFLEIMAIYKAGGDYAGRTDVELLSVQLLDAEGKPLDDAKSGRSTAEKAVLEIKVAELTSTAEYMRAADYPRRWE